MKILFLTRFGQQGASSRLRALDYIPWFKSASIEATVSPLFNDAMLSRKYRYGDYGLMGLLATYLKRVCVLATTRQYDLIWIEKEALPWLPAWLEKWLLRGRPYVLDFDDAIFHNYDLHRFDWVQRVYGRRIDRLMAGARLITAGNQYLANRAIASGARWVEIVPTVIDLRRYAAKTVYSKLSEPRIVWIGSPSTVKYLLGLAVPLGALSKLRPFTLRVIGAEVKNMPGVNVETLPWRLNTEAGLIGECDIGIMPLQDSPWERGKCGYKLIQYMASGLPVVASGVGVNSSIVRVGENGLLANSGDEWVAALGQLLNSADLRRDWGMAGRQRVEDEFCTQKIGSRLAQLLRTAGQVGS